MKSITAKPLASYSHEWKVLPQQIVPIAATKAPAGSPADMVKIPAADFVFHVQGIEIEGFNDIGVDVQYPWEDTPRRFHEHPMHVKSFWIDKYPVTNAHSKSSWMPPTIIPQDDLNFLRDWQNGSYPDGGTTSR